MALYVVRYGFVVASGYIYIRYACVGRYAFSGAWAIYEQQ